VCKDTTTPLIAYTFDQLLALKPIGNFYYSDITHLKQKGELSYRQSITLRHKRDHFPRIRLMERSIN
jgi:hypothetical protein